MSETQAIPASAGVADRTRVATSVSGATAVFRAEAQQSVIRLRRCWPSMTVTERIFARSGL